MMYSKSKLGMFEEVTDPMTGETFYPTSGRARYNNIKSSKGNTFESRSSDPHILSLQEKRSLDPYAH